VAERPSNSQHSTLHGLKAFRVQFQRQKMWLSSPYKLDGGTIGIARHLDAFPVQKAVDKHDNRRCHHKLQLVLAARIVLALQQGEDPYHAQKQHGHVRRQKRAEAHMMDIRDHQHHWQAP